MNKGYLADDPHIMNTTSNRPIKDHSGFAKQPETSTGIDALHHLAFDNSLMASIISTVSTGQIISVNKAACKLFGYSKKELLTKRRSAIFDVTEKNFKTMLHQGKTEGHSIALVKAIKKNGLAFSTEVTSAVFLNEEGVENAIFSITDLSQSILKQKRIDREKDKIVSRNIDLALSKQKEIDAKKDQVVAENIILAQAKSDARLHENNEWIKYIAKTSYDVMWDLDVASGEIYVGDSIEEVFGYKLQNNRINFTDFISILLPEEKKHFEKKLLKIFDSPSKYWKDAFLLKRDDGSVATTTSRASILRDDAGKAIRLIGATQDVSKLQELETKLEEQMFMKEEQKLFLTSKLSFDVMWDWNLLTNEVFIGDDFEELFGYAIKNNKGKIADKGNHLHPDDKTNWEKGLHVAISSSVTHWEHAYRFIRADGTIARVFDRASIIRHPGGKAYRMIGTMQDVSRQKELQEMQDYQTAIKTKLLSDYKENFTHTFKSSYDIFYDYDLIADDVMVSDAFQIKFGYKITTNMTLEACWVSHIHPADKHDVFENYLGMLASKDIEWKYKYRFLKSDNSVTNVLTTAIILRNTEGVAYRIIGHMQDMSNQNVLEEKINRDIELLENKIATATKVAGNMQQQIGKEVDNNVTQLLSASQLYVDMAKRSSEHWKMYLNRSAEYTAMAMEEIRNLEDVYTTTAISNTGLCEAIENLIRDEMKVNPVKISSANSTFIEHSVNDKFKFNIFCILRDHLHNILNHAQATEIAIHLSQNKNFITLIISDNGMWSYADKSERESVASNIKANVSSYNGAVDFVSQAGQASILTISFPVKDTLLEKMTTLNSTNEKKHQIIEKIKNAIVQLVRSSEDKVNSNLSDYLSQQLDYSYTYLANVFSEAEGTTIQKFIISQKIECVKELLVKGDLSLTEIAWKLHYSSVAHLSNQFKKLTGLTPSSFKTIHH